MKPLSKIIRAGCVMVALISQTSCVTFSAKVSSATAVDIPYLKNSANECYYLDDFMPLPDRLVTGKHGTLGLRYYSYNTANYKDFDPSQKIILSFYSVDQRCWSLFEEYLLTN